MTEIRLIPAHAGKIGCPDKRSSCSRAHPRSRGENLGCIASLCCLLGSSPLTRGKFHGTRRWSLADRLIPAHAGKMPTSITSPALMRAHPRSRGENVALAEGVGPAMGSSPLTRGKFAEQILAIPGERLIPAHAGKIA